jgi:hypothetical protein
VFLNTTNFPTCPTLSHYYSSEYSTVALQVKR